MLVFFAGSSDRLFVFLGLSYTAQIWFWRFAVWIIPVIVGIVVARWCRALVAAERVEAVSLAARQSGDGTPRSP